MEPLYELFYSSMVLPIISYCPYVLRIAKVWSMLPLGSVDRVQSKECYFMFTYAFLKFFVVVFHPNICVFCIFISFLMKYQIFKTEY